MNERIGDEMKKNVSAIVLAAGVGSRMKSDVAKQYLMLGDKTILEHTLEVFQESEVIDEIILVVGEADVMECGRMFFSDDRFTKVMQIIAGGKERYNSVQIGLQCIDEETEIVMVHDGARPLVDEGLLVRGYEAMDGSQASIAAVPVKDTIKLVNTQGVVESTTDREKTMIVQTPQVFTASLIQEAFAKWEEIEDTDITDDAMMVERYTGAKVTTFLGDYRNIKITTQEDLLLAKLYMEECK